MNLAKRARARRDLPAVGQRSTIRLAAGVTQSELAVMIGVSRQAVHLWETGQRSPRGEAMERYVAALRVMEAEAR